MSTDSTVSIISELQHGTTSLSGIRRVTEQEIEGVQDIVLLAASQCGELLGTVTDSNECVVHHVQTVS